MLRKLRIRPKGLNLDDVDLFTPARYPGEVIHPDDADNCEEQLHCYRSARSVGEKSAVIVRYLSSEDERQDNTKDFKRITYPIARAM